jgi:hypothetical protein
LLVQRDDTGTRTPEIGVRLPAVHSARSVIEGPIVQRTYRLGAAERLRFDSRWVH